MEINDGEKGIFATNDGHFLKDDVVLTTLSRQDHTRSSKKEKKRNVTFPDDDRLVSKSVEPFDPWANGILLLKSL